MAGLALNPQGLYSPGASADPPGYGRAKERIGSETGAAIKTLREQMGGQIGSGLYTRRLRDIVMSGQSELGDVNSQMAEKEADRAFQEKESNKNRALTAATEGLRQAMSAPRHEYIDPYGRNWGDQHWDQAVEQARQQLQALTGYSGMSMSARGGY